MSAADSLMMTVCGRRGCTDPLCTGCPFDASDYERPAKKTPPRGVRGTIVTSHAVLHVAVYAVGPQWRADAVVEIAGRAAEAQLPVTFNAATPREAWAAVSADVLRKLGRWLEAA